MKKTILIIVSFLLVIPSCAPNEEINQGETKKITETGAVTDITEISARISGYVRPTPEMGIVKMGIVYSTNASPSLENGVELSSKEVDNNDMYVVTARNLSSSTTYYYKSFIQYGGIYHFGDVKSFTTAEVKASITTGTATSVTEFKATLNGFLKVNSNNDLPKSVWFLYSNNASSLETLKSNGKKVDAVLASDGSFDYKLTNLNYGEEYHYVAVAKVHDKEFYGSVASTRTQVFNVNVETTPPTGVTEFRATLGGKLTVKSNENLSKDVWFLFSKGTISLEELKSRGIRVNSSLNDDGTFQKFLSDLEYGTKYSFVAVASVHNMDYYSEVSSFSTLDINGVVETPGASGITETKATLNAKLSINNIEELPKRVWFLYSDTASSLDDLISHGKKLDSTLDADGSFKYSLSNLSSGTTYYYVAVAKVYDREFYSEVTSTSTLGIDAALEVFEASNVLELEATLKGQLSADTKDILSKKVSLLYSESASTLNDLISSGEQMDIELQADGSFEGKLTNLVYGVRYYYAVVANIYDRTFYSQVFTFTTKDFLEITDLGLSVKWRGWNIGSTVPGGFGDYFFWGETVTHTRYLAGEYIWQNSNGLIKYNTSPYYGIVDNKTRLEEDDDVAHTRLGGTWRIPTKEEMEELISGCTWTWSKVNGYTGYIVRSKTNGNSIFLPAVGYMNNFERKYGFITGYYWTSSLNTDSPNEAFILYFDTSSVNCINYERTWGVVVRPFCE